MAGCASAGSVAPPIVFGTGTVGVGVAGVLVTFVPVGCGCTVVALLCDAVGCIVGPGTFTPNSAIMAATIMSNSLKIMFPTSHVGYQLVSIH